MSLIEGAGGAEGLSKWNCKSFGI